MDKIYPPESDFKLFRISPTTEVNRCSQAIVSLLKNEDNDKRPICLYTLPKREGTDPTKLIETLENLIVKSKSNPSNNSIVKLISIVEIVKREFLKSYEGKVGSEFDKLVNEDKQKNNSEGDDDDEKVILHQYNQLNCLENLISIILNSPDNNLECNDDGDGNGSVSQKRRKLDEDRTVKILNEFLDQERKRPKRTHTPYMKVYVSLNKIEALNDNNEISYQPLVLRSDKKGQNNSSDKFGLKTKLGSEKTRNDDSNNLINQGVSDNTLMDISRFDNDDSGLAPV